MSSSALKKKRDLAALTPQWLCFRDSLQFPPPLFMGEVGWHAVRSLICDPRAIGWGCRGESLDLGKHPHFLDILASFGFFDSRQCRPVALFPRLFSTSPAAGEGGTAHFSLLAFARNVPCQVRAGGRHRPTAAESRASPEWVCFCDFEPPRRSLKKVQYLPDDFGFVWFFRIRTRTPSYRPRHPFGDRIIIVAEFH